MVAPALAKFPLEICDVECTSTVKSCDALLTATPTVTDARWLPAVPDEARHCNDVSDVNHVLSQDVIPTLAAKLEEYPAANNLS